MAAISRRRGGAADYTWPGYVDALTTLLMVLIFLLTVFSVAQFTLSNALSSRDSAIDQLNQQVGDLASQLSIEKKPARTCRRTSSSSPCSCARRAPSATAGADLAAERKTADALKIERDQLSERPDLDAGRARPARRRAADAAKEPRPR